MDKINLQLVRDAFGRVVYAHKAHEKDAEIQRGQAVIVKWVNIVLLTLTSGGILTTLVTELLRRNSTGILVATSLVAFATLGFSIFQLSFNPEQIAAAHKVAANRLWTVREKYRHLIADIVTGRLGEGEVVSLRNALAGELAAIYETAPATSSKAYGQASTGLKHDEEFSFSDEEIDRFLPTELALSPREDAAQSK